MRRTIVLSSLVSAVVAVLTLLLVQHAFTPKPVAAQSDQPQEVRASKFTLVSPDGVVIGSWESRPAQRVTRGGVDYDLRGGGRLSIFNQDGKQRVAIAPDGLFGVYDADGATLRFIAGYTQPQSPGPTGNPPLNGIQLNDKATIDYVLGSP
jgi:hypothetical protein